MQTNLFKNEITTKQTYYISYILNNLPWLICHKTQPKQIIYI